MNDDQPLSTHEFSLLSSTLPLLDPWTLIRRLHASVIKANDRAAQASSDYDNAVDAIKHEAISHRRLLAAVDAYLLALRATGPGSADAQVQTLAALREEVAQSHRELGCEPEELDGDL